MSLLAPKKRRRAQGKPKLRVAISERQREKEVEAQRERRAGQLLFITVGVLAVLALILTLVFAAA